MKIPLEKLRRIVLISLWNYLKTRKEFHESVVLYLPLFTLQKTNTVANYFQANE